MKYLKFTLFAGLLVALAFVVGTYHVLILEWIQENPELAIALSIAMATILGVWFLWFRKENGPDTPQQEDSVTKPEEKIMKLPITGGVMIVALELLITSVGTIAISLYETGKLLPPAMEWSAELSLANVWLILGLVYTGASFRFDQLIQADQLAVRTIFGRPTDVMSSGVPILPPGIGDQIVLPTDVIQDEHPGEPEKIFRNEDQQAVPDGMVPPFRVTFGAAISEDAARNMFKDEFSVTDRYGREIEFKAEVEEDLLSKRVTGEVVTVSRYRIVEAIPFVKFIGGTKQASGQIEDEIFGVVQRIYPKISLAQALQNIDWMNAILYEAAKRRVSAVDGRQAWGIDIEDAFVKSLPQSHSLNNSIQSIAETEADAVNRERLAETDRVEREKAGQGDAAAEQALLEARGDGYHYIAIKTRVKGAELAQRTDAARQLAEAGNVIVTDGNGATGSLLGLITAGAAVANREKISGNSQLPEGETNLNESEN
ncbi:MAG: hypothetical protein AAGA35_01685 [Patescibacteria group bacterium]